MSAKVKRAIMEIGEDPPTGLSFWCPACDEAHCIKVNVPGWWTWNGDFERPTIGGDPKRSIKCESTRFSELGERQYEHWRQTGEHPPGEKYDSKAICCHSTITDGMISFCGDCTHALINQTVPLPDWPESRTE